MESNKKTEDRKIPDSQDEKKAEQREKIGKERDTGEGIHRKNATVIQHNVFAQRETLIEKDRKRCKRCLFVRE